MCVGVSVWLGWGGIRVESSPDFLNEDKFKTSLMVYEMIHFTTIS